MSDDVFHEFIAGDGRTDESPVALTEAGSGRILVVDDDASVRRGLCRSLRKDGYTVTEARSAAEAWDVVHREHARPEVMVLDLMLPDETGLSFLARLPQPLGMGVVLVSGQGRIPHAVEALRLGAMDFLEKPIGLAELRPVIVRALATRRSQLGEAFAQSLEHVASPEPPLGPPRALAGALPRRAIAGPSTRQNTSRDTSQDGMSQAGSPTADESGTVEAPSGPVPPRGPLQSILDESERRLLRSTLELCEGNVAAAARVLQLDRGNLFRRLRRLGMK